jgi:hypothetical protein
VRCCAGFGAALREANRGDRSGDVFGKLKADVRVTRQTRKRSAAEALRILFVTAVEDFARNATYLSSTKTAGRPRAVVLVTQPRVMERWSIFLNIEHRTPSTGDPPAALDVGCSMLGVFRLLSPET